MSRPLAVGPIAVESVEDRRRRLSRERVRRFRERDDEGIRLITIGLTDHRIENLIELGEIDRASSDDGATIRAALQDYLDRSIAADVRRMFGVSGNALHRKRQLSDTDFSNDEQTDNDDRS